MEPNKIEKQFKELLNSREIKPSEKAWDKLDAMLAAADKKPKRNFKWLYVAASFVGFLLVGTIYFNRFDSGKIDKVKPVVFEGKAKEKILEDQEIIKEDVSQGQNHKEVTKKETVVTYVNNQKNHPNKLNNKEEEVVAINHLNEDNEIVNSSETKNNKLPSKNKYISAEQLLAEVSGAKFEKATTEKTIEITNKAITINPNDLLLNAETELNQSYRESALDRLNKNFKAVKTVLANRNYKE